MEKILFCNSFNQTEYLRTLAKLNQDSFGLRVMNDVSLCNYILEHSVAYPEGNYISSKEEDYIYYSLLGENYNDAKNLRSTIDSFRDCIKGDVLKELDTNLSNDFLEKKELIKSKYKAYADYKNNNLLYDKNDLIEFVLNQNIKLDIECFYYEEMGIAKTFLEMLNKVFKKVTVLKLNNTFKPKQKEINFLKAYGKVCEADYIFSQIQKYPLDECEIVLTNTNDALEVFKVAEMLDIPYTSSIGVPVFSTKAGIFLSYLFKLEDKLYGVDGYRLLLNASFFNNQTFKELIPADYYDPNRYFNDFIKYAGWLRLNFDSKKEDIHEELYDREMASMLFKLQDSLSKGYASFIKEYLIEPSPLDESIIELIKQAEEAANKYHFEIKDVLKDLLSKNVNKKVAASSHLYITTTDNALAALRKHVFIMGLDSDFPGDPKENYLIFDEEYINAGSDLYVSKNIVKRKEEVLRALISASEDVYLTYPYFEVGSLDDNNPSSIMFDLYPKDIVKEPMPTYGYQDIKLSMNKEVYQARLNNEKSGLPINQFSLAYNKGVLLNKKYSPSMFHYFFEENYKLSFLLSCILGINIDDEDDPYVIIAPNEKGDLIHHIMEGFQKDKVSKAEFIANAEKEFANYLLKKPPVIPSLAIKEKDDFLRLINNLYDDDPNNRYVKSERYVNGEILGIKFGGFYDRIEKDKTNGKYILVDYKTGSSVKHINEDPVTCIQGLIYAYLIDNDLFYQSKGIHISSIEFRYPDSRDVVKITYTPANKQTLIDKVNEFKAAIEDQALFTHLEFKEQKYIDKYQYLFSLLKEVKAL